MDQMGVIGQYWNIRSDGYSKGILDELRENEKEWQERLRKLLDGIPGKKVLDMGCGPGFFTILLAAQGYEVTAFDYSSGMLAKAEKNVSDLDLKAEFVQGDAQNLPFEDNMFDGIISRNLTWNLEHPERAYAEWMRVLKPGGYLINFDGNHYSYYYREEYQFEREQQDYSDGHNPEYLKGIDVSIIDNIARKLPLSREMRPKWDINILLDTGVSQISTEIAHHRFTHEDGREYNIIKNFILKAVK